MGLLFCFLGAISFGLLGSALKAAERKKADAAGLVVAAYAWPAMIMLVRTLLLKSGSPIPPKAFAIAVIFGICAAVASLAFQAGVARTFSVGSRLFLAVRNNAKFREEPRTYRTGPRYVFNPLVL